MLHQAAPKRGMPQATSYAAALCLALILMGNVMPPLFIQYWRALLPYLPHEHIFLGPIAPGWEYHSHGEPASLRQNQSGRCCVERYTPSDAGDTGKAKQPPVISTYRSPTDGSNIISAGFYPALLLSEWFYASGLSQFVWFLDLTTPLPGGVFLQSPDKPPQTAPDFSLT